MRCTLQKALDYQRCTINENQNLSGCSSIKCAEYIHRCRRLSSLSMNSVHYIGQLALHFRQLEPIDIIFASRSRDVTRFGSDDEGLWVPFFGTGGEVKFG